jgi:hypothetical protein
MYHHDLTADPMMNQVTGAGAWRILTLSSLLAVLVFLDCSGLGLARLATEPAWGAAAVHVLGTNSDSISSLTVMKGGEVKWSVKVDKGIVQLHPFCV